MLNSKPSSNFHIKFLRIGLSQEAPTVGMMPVEICMWIRPGLYLRGFLVTQTNQE